MNSEDVKNLRRKHRQMVTELRIELDRELFELCKKWTGHRLYTWRATEVNAYQQTREIEIEECEYCGFQARTLKGEWQ